MPPPAYMTPMQIPGLIDPVPVPRAATPRADGKTAIVGLTRPELIAALVAAGLPDKAAKMRASQVWHWVYHRGVTEFESMANIARETRSVLDRHFVVGRPEVAQAQVSADGTRKWLLRFADGNEAECVFIPDADRGTLCVSSQVGCTLNCRFCFTGTMKLVRNLTPGEIVGQVMLARDALGEWPAAGVATPDGSYSAEGRMLTNIVMMGMGEPLYNFEGVKAALGIVMDATGLGLSKRRITLSTSAASCR